MLYLIAVSIIWSLSFSLIKGQLTSIDPNLVAFLRLLISFFIFLPLLKIRHLKMGLIFHFLIIGAIQYGMMYSTYIYSFQYLKAYEIVILTIFTPIFIVLFNDIWIKQFVYINWIKALLAVIGAGIILYSDNITFGFWKGIILVQFSNVLFALGQVYYKQLIEKYKIDNQKKHFTILFAGGMLVTGIFSFYTQSFDEINISLNQFLVILYLGAVASGIGFFLWNYGITKISIGKVAILNNLKIPLGILFAAIILNESVNIIQLILGSTLIIAAFYIDKIFFLTGKEV